MKLFVRLFRKPGVWGEDQREINFDSRKVEELFYYLLLNNKGPHTREALAALLWVEHSETQSKKYLRQALWRLNAALSVYNNGTSILQSESRWLSIKQPDNIWIDTAAFEQIYLNNRWKRGVDIDGPVYEELLQAVELYQGDLLEGWYQDWCLLERERLQNMLLEILDQLMDYCEAHMVFGQGLAFGERILTFDRARETTHRRLMHLYYLMGDRTGALRQYQDCVAALMEELDVSPSQSTLALLNQVQQDAIETPIPLTGDLPVQPKGANDLPHPAVPKILDNLYQLHSMILEFQELIEKGIRDAELALKMNK